MSRVCKELGVKDSYINTVIKFTSDIKTEKVAHRLSICKGENCKSKGSSELHDHIIKKYKVNPGKVSEKYGFSYDVCGCMKQCAKGPNIRWDGKIYSKVTTKMLDSLITEKIVK